MGPLPRHPSALLASIVVLTSACSRDLPTTANTSSTKLGAFSASLSPAVGPCGLLTRAPFTTPSGRQVGTVYTYFDDYNVYGAFQSEPGVTLSQTSLGLYEMQSEIPTNSSGLVAWNRLPFQSLKVPPGTWVRQHAIMDSVNDYLGQYRAVPRAVLQLPTGTKFELWAGTVLGWDPIAREVVDRMQGRCLPRVVVLNDRNMLDNGGLSGNTPFADLLLWFVEQPRSMGQISLPRQMGQQPVFGVMFDRGRNSPCWQDGSCGDTALTALRTQYTSVPGQEPGVEVSDIFSTPGSLTSFPPEVGLLFLWLPRQIYTMDEINALKQYVTEGGRIVFMGEESGYYDGAGKATLDQFLADMGSGARVKVGAFDCGGYRDLSLREEVIHRLTSWSPGVRVQCTGALTTGFLDFNLFHDATGKVVTGASVAVDTLPIVAHGLVVPER